MREITCFSKPKSIEKEAKAAPTSVTEVIYEDDLRDEVVRRAVGDAVHRPQQGRPALVVEGNYYTGVGQVLQIQLLSAAEEEDEEQ